MVVDSVPEREAAIPESRMREQLNHASEFQDNHRYLMTSPPNEFERIDVLRVPGPVVLRVLLSYLSGQSYQQSFSKEISRIHS